MEHRQGPANVVKMADLSDTVDSPDAPIINFVMQIKALRIRHASSLNRITRMDVT